MADKLIRLAVAAGAGLLMYASFPPVGWWWSAVPALALLTAVLVSPRSTLGGGFGCGLLFGLAFYLPLLPWISGLVGAVPWVALAGVQALFPAAFGMFAVIVARLPGWPLWLACLWSLQEWLKSSIPFGGFPWGVVAFSQSDGPLLALAQWGGAPLVSFAVALAGTSLCALVIAMRSRLTRLGGGVGDRRTSLFAGASVCAVILGTVVAAIGPGPSGTHADEPTAVIAAVQGNVPRLGLDFNSQRRAVLDNHVKQTLKLAQDVEAGRVARPLFVIWPENSSDIDPLANPDAARQIDTAAQAIGAPILVGAVVDLPEATAQRPAASNTVIVWDPVDGPGERHDKQIVQPFGEYLPWRAFFSRLSSYADRAGYFVPGSGSGVVYPAGVPVGVATCWEVIFDRALRQSVRNGAQVLAVPTNNATFDEAMSQQQLAFAKLRAVEHGRYVIVAGTTGISAAIAPDGREIARTAFFTPAYLDVRVGLRTAENPATRWAATAQWLMIATAVTAIGAAILHNGFSTGFSTGGSAGGSAGRFVRPLRNRSNEPGEGVA
ncbi:MAG: apolipoprotein N-acyltransferase [Mycobacterium sp.]|nr:apolipoprotein N-acyltransferase [Mycobacterium sp.]